MLPSILSKVHPQYQTPSNALIFQASLSIVFLLLGSVETLLNIFSNGVWLFYAFCGTGVLVLRWRQSRHPWIVKSSLWIKGRLAPIYARYFNYFHVRLEESTPEQDENRNCFDNVEMDNIKESQENHRSTMSRGLSISTTMSEAPLSSYSSSADIFRVPLPIACTFSATAWALTFLPFASAPGATVISWLFVFSGIPLYYFYERIATKLGE
jgi:amino acid transporter